jgi:hypothetical protein
MMLMMGKNTAEAPDINEDGNWKIEVFHKCSTITVWRTKD